VALVYYSLVPLYPKSSDDLGCAANESQLYHLVSHKKAQKAQLKFRLKAVISVVPFVLFCG
jgi:hypothetical protein